MPYRTFSYRLYSTIMLSMAAGFEVGDKPKDQEPIQEKKEAE